MSLIEEALRRIQDPSIPKGGATATPQNPQAPAQEPPPAHSWPTAPASPTATSPQTPRALNAVAVAIVGLTAVLLLGGIIWLGRTRNGTASAPEPAPVAAPAQQAATPQAAPTPVQKPAWQEMVLSGIVVGVGEPYAVINGEIVGRGDRIGNATLLDIAQDSVTIQLPNGKETVLKIPR